MFIKKKQMKLVYISFFHVDLAMSSFVCARCRCLHFCLQIINRVTWCKRCIIIVAWFFGLSNAFLIWWRSYKIARWSDFVTYNLRKKILTQIRIRLIRPWDMRHWISIGCRRLLNGSRLQMCRTLVSHHADIIVRMPYRLQWHIANNDRYLHRRIVVHGHFCFYPNVIRNGNDATAIDTGRRQRRYGQTDFIAFFIVWFGTGRSFHHNRPSLFFRVVWWRLAVVHNHLAQLESHVVHVCTAQVDYLRLDDDRLAGYITCLRHASS